jgi:hypothetical protein
MSKKKPPSEFDALDVPIIRPIREVYDLEPQTEPFEVWQEQQIQIRKLEKLNLLKKQMGVGYAGLALALAERCVTGFQVVDRLPMGAGAPEVRDEFHYLDVFVRVERARIKARLPYRKGSFAEAIDLLIGISPSASEHRREAQRREGGFKTLQNTRSEALNPKHNHLAIMLTGWSELNDEVRAARLDVISDLVERATRSRQEDRR